MRIEHTAEGPKFFSSCDLCRREFRVGPHRYEGRRVPAWDVMICDPCRSCNWDGIVPQSYPDFFRRLQENGVTISLNAKGWVAIPD